MPLLVNLTKAVLLPKVLTYIFTLHQTVFQPNVVVRPSYSSGSRTLQTLIGVLYNNSHPYRCQLFRYWARVTLCLRCSLSNALTWARLTVFSVFEVGNNHSYFQAQYFTSRLYRLPHNHDLDILPQFNFLSAESDIFNNSA